MKRKGCTPAGLMESAELHAELESLHPDSFGWALVCCARDREFATNTLQAVYLKILNGKAIFEGKASFKTWLFGVIKRTAAEEHRQRKLGLLRFVRLDQVKELGSRGETAPREQSLGIRDVDNAADSSVYRNEVQEIFRIEVAALPVRQREVLHLVFYQDLTLAEAAEVLGVSLGSVRTHYDRGKKRLKARLIELGVTSNAGLER